MKINKMNNENFRQNRENPSRMFYFLFPVLADCYVIAHSLITNSDLYNAPRGVTHFQFYNFHVFQLNLYPPRKKLLMQSLASIMNCRIAPIARRINLQKYKIGKSYDSPSFCEELKGFPNDFFLREKFSFVGESLK